MGQVIIEERCISREEHCLGCHSVILVPEGVDEISVWSVEQISFSIGTPAGVTDYVRLSLRCGGCNIVLS